MSDERLLGPASVTWNDYRGTAAADDADAIANSRSLYEMSGLDRDRWTIVSIDLDRRDAQQQVTVYAFDRVGHGVRSQAELLEYGQQAGLLPVTAFHLDDPAQVDAFRQEAFKRTSVRLVAREISDHQLTIERHESLRPTSSAQMLD